MAATGPTAAAAAAAAVVVVVVIAIAVLKLLLLFKWRNNLIYVPMNQQRRFTDRSNLRAVEIAHK